MWSKDSNRFWLNGPTNPSTIVPVMNTQYNHIYLTDKSEQHVSKVPQQELEEATKGLKLIKDDDFVTVWDGKSYQVFAIKAWAVQANFLRSFL